MALQPVDSPIWISTSARRGFAVVERFLPAAHMTPLHAQPVDETLEVLEGTLIVYTGTGAIRLEAGEALTIPAHALRTIKAGACGTRLLFAASVASAARYEDFLRAAAPPLEESASGRWPCLEEAAGLTAIAAANGIVLAGPPGSLPAAHPRRAAA